MLYVSEKTVKLGGKQIGGQVTNIEIQSSANIHVQQNKKGKITKMQASGYEQIKVVIDVTFESTKKKSANAQLKAVQTLFRGSKQKKAKLLKIVNTTCTSCGVSQVYFKSITVTKVISQSKIVASLELWAPKTAGITIKKKLLQANIKARKEAIALQRKSKKSKSKSPAKDTKPTANTKKNAKMLAN